ncbi:polymorphic toxin-type HINT domain-containing protein, partial [Laceyella putida]
TKKRVRVAKGKVKRTYKKAKATAKRTASKAKQKLRGGAKSKPSPKQKFACARCFTAGTKIVTDKGKKDIQTIRLGDKVLAKDPNTGKQAFKTVQLLFKRTVKELYEIKIGKEKLQTTGEHPFWVKDKGWVVAKDLKPGDFFQTASGTYIAIDQIQRVKKNAVVYNFTVEDFHTYYVSDLQIFTHNTGKGDECGPKKSSIPGQGYHKETYGPKPVKPKDATKKWEEFLGEGPYTNKHPRTGQPDPDRLVSKDGKRSIRYGNHEMNSKPTKHHYHEETWTYDEINDVMNVDNVVIRVPLPKGK